MQGTYPISRYQFKSENPLAVSCDYNDQALYLNLTRDLAHWGVNVCKMVAGWGLWARCADHAPGSMPAQPKLKLDIEL